MEDIKKGNKVKVIQYDYSGNNGFSGTPRVKTANASVKLGEDSGGTQDDYAALSWMISRTGRLSHNSHVNVIKNCNASNVIKLKKNR